jgi:putative transcriptional regulator
VVADDFATGQLLVATPLIKDGVFDRTIVLVLHHDDEGALGVVLNRPSEVNVGLLLPQWEPAASSPRVIFYGGPVATSHLLGLSRQLPDPDTGLAVIGALELDSTPELHRLDAVRIFTGYAGWSAGQLEGEISAGGWYVVPTDPDDAFTSEPVDLWRRVLRRQPGQLAVVATFPEDPTLN